MTIAQKRTRARELRRHGKTIREIAEDLRVSVNTAHRYVDADFERRQLERNRENKRRRREEEESRP